MVDRPSCDKIIEDNGLTIEVEGMQEKGTLTLQSRVVVKTEGIVTRRTEVQSEV